MASKARDTGGQDGSAAGRPRARIRAPPSGELSGVRLTTRARVSGSQAEAEAEAEAAAEAAAEAGAGGGALALASAPQVRAQCGFRAATLAACAANSRPALLGLWRAARLSLSLSRNALQAREKKSCKQFAAGLQSWPKTPAAWPVVLVLQWRLTKAGSWRRRTRSRASERSELARGRKPGAWPRATRAPLVVEEEEKRAR